MESVLSPFIQSVVVTIISSLVAAFAGAYGGQLIVERGKARAELTTEIRHTNAAIMIAFTVSNRLLSAKKQLIKSLKETFDKQRAEFLEFKRKYDAGEIPPTAVYQFQADLRTLPPLDVPTTVLQNQVFDKLSLVGRPLAICATLVGAVEALNLSIGRRNQLIEEYKVSGLPPPVYFGLPFSSGSVNQDYPNSVEAIYSQTDDAIFFSTLLCGDPSRTRQ